MKCIEKKFYTPSKILFHFCAMVLVTSLLHCAGGSNPSQTSNNLDPSLLGSNTSGSLTGSGSLSSLGNIFSSTPTASDTTLSSGLPSTTSSSTLSTMSSMVTPSQQLCLSSNSGFMSGAHGVKGALLKFRGFSFGGTDLSSLFGSTATSTPVTTSTGSYSSSPVCFSSSVNPSALLGQTGLSYLGAQANVSDFCMQAAPQNGNTNQTQWDNAYVGGMACVLRYYGYLAQQQQLLDNGSVMQSNDQLNQQMLYLAILKALGIN